MEEELRVVGNNLKSLELSEEKALEREDTYNNQIRELTTRLKEVEDLVQAIQPPNCTIIDLISVIRVQCN